MINYEDLKQTALFAGLGTKEIVQLLDCVRARRVRFAKDELIIEEGNQIHEFGILLSGCARSIKWDASDKLIIITLLEKGSEIGVLLAASPERESPVSVQAQENVSMLLIPYERLIAHCGKACLGHERLLRNYIGIVAEKGLVLHERLDCLLKPTVREKILSYLLRIASEQQSQSISIPMNRNEMAEYLNIERSALSRELSYMKRDGLIAYHRNRFWLLDKSLEIK